MSERMLSELRNVRQVPGEPRRRWFSSKDEDLIVWYAPDGTIHGFQLCYDRNGVEQAVTCLPGGHLAWSKVDDGEAVGFAHKRSPILADTGPADLAGLLERLPSLMEGVPQDIARFVTRRLGVPKATSASPPVHG